MFQYASSGDALHSEMGLMTSLKWASQKHGKYFPGSLFGEKIKQLKDALLKLKIKQINFAEGFDHFSTLINEKTAFEACLPLQPNLG